MFSPLVGNCCPTEGSVLVSVHSNLLCALFLILGTGDLHTFDGDDCGDHFSTARFLESSQRDMLYAHSECLPFRVTSLESVCRGNVTSGIIGVGSCFCLCAHRHVAYKFIKLRSHRGIKLQGGTRLNGCAMPAAGLVTMEHLGIGMQKINVIC